MTSARTFVLLTVATLSACAGPDRPVPPEAAVSTPEGWRSKLTAPSDHSQPVNADWRSEEHTSELQSLMRISYAVFCLKKKKKKQMTTTNKHIYNKEIKRQDQWT